VGFEPARDHGDGLADVIDAVLDRGLVINADITVSLAGVELLGIKIRAALASFETAAMYGLEFPSGTNLKAPGWRAAMPVEARGNGYGETAAGQLAAEAPAHVPAR
jgi:gas vesicle structural protein